MLIVMVYPAIFVIVLAKQKFRSKDLWELGLELRTEAAMLHLQLELAF